MSRTGYQECSVSRPRYQECSVSGPGFRGNEYLSLNDSL